MHDDQLHDLKQSISSTVSQTKARLNRQLGEVGQRLERLEQKVDDLDLKVDTISEALHKNLSDHELRLTRLEQQTT